MPAQPAERPLPALPGAPSTDQVTSGAAAPGSGPVGSSGAAIGNGLGLTTLRPSPSAVVVRARKRSGYISSEDYPRRALAEKAEGTTSATLTIGESGLVSACSITSSSGRADLDATVCRLISARFRFEPARNIKGEPVSEVRVETFTWILPGND